jgi:hypothetical protein
MRRPTIAYAQKGLPVQCLSERDFLFPDADEKYVPEVLAYIQSYDFKTFNALLWTKTPEEVIATFPYLSDREKSFACRALFEQWSKCLAEGWDWSAAAPHGMDGAAKAQRSRRDRYARRFRRITTSFLHALLLHKGLVRVGCRGERNRPHLSGAAYAPPFPDKAPLPEKIGLHVQPIEPVHVLLVVGAVQDDGIVNHGRIMHLM